MKESLFSLAYAIQFTLIGLIILSTLTKEIGLVSIIFGIGFFISAIYNFNKEKKSKSSEEIE